MTLQIVSFPGTCGQEASKVVSHSGQKEATEFQEKTVILIQIPYVNLLPERKVQSNLEKKENQYLTLNQNQHDPFSIRVPGQEDMSENKL